MDAPPEREPALARRCDLRLRCLFISYGQRDALAYAAALARLLRKGNPKLRVFLDVDGFQAGDILTTATARAVGRSSALAVVTPAAFGVSSLTNWSGRFQPALSLRRSQIGEWRKSTGGLHDNSPFLDDRT